MFRRSLLLRVFGVWLASFLLALGALLPLWSSVSPWPALVLPVAVAAVAAYVFYRRVRFGSALARETQRFEEAISHIKDL
jgi:hypothetical protein